MDLETILATVMKNTEEASRAFHAGHRDVSEKYLRETRTAIGDFFEVKTQEGGWFKEEAQSGIEQKEPSVQPDADPGQKTTPAPAQVLPAQGQDPKAKAG